MTGDPPLRILGIFGLLDGPQAAVEAERLRYRLSKLDERLESIVETSIRFHAKGPQKTSIVRKLPPEKNWPVSRLVDTPLFYKGEPDSEGVKDALRVLRVTIDQFIHDTT